eukprot:427563-Pleurochrysis_carterae.AAC.2
MQQTRTTDYQSIDLSLTARSNMQIGFPSTSLYNTILSSYESAESPPRARATQQQTVCTYSIQNFVRVASSNLQIR